MRLGQADGYSSGFGQLFSGILTIIGGCSLGNFSGNLLTVNFWGLEDLSPFHAIWAMVVCMQYFTGICAVLGIVVLGCIAVFSETNRLYLFTGIYALQAYLAARYQCPDNLLETVLDRGMNVLFSWAF